MLVLVMDSATPAITAAAVDIADGGDVTVLAERVTVDGRLHGERLAPSVSEVLTEAGARGTDLAAIVVGLGPGPFTGLRVGLVTAASMADTLGIPAYGVCSLDGIGTAPAVAVSGRVLVATDARRREVYWAVYEGGQRITDPAVDRPTEIAAPPGLTVAAGDGALLYADVLGLPLLDGPRYPLPGALATCAAAKVLGKAPGDPLTPLYLRRPDAVEPGARKPVS